VKNIGNISLIINHKLQIVLISLFSLLFISNHIFAQPGPGINPLMFLGRGNSVLDVRYDYFNPSEFHQVIVHYSTLMVPRMGDNINPGNLVSTTILEGGFCFKKQDSTVFRYRAALVDANFSRKLIALGFTALDYDKTTLLEKNLRWFNGRLGLTKSFRIRRLILAGRLVGTAGYTELLLGRTFYSNYGTAADSSLSGFEAGYIISGTLLFKKINCNIVYHNKVLLDNPEPQFKIFSIDLFFHLLGKRGGGFLIHVNYENEKSELNLRNLFQKNRKFTVGLSYIIIPTKRRTPDWDDF
jgi:hypothetical protein